MALPKTTEDRIEQQAATAASKVNDTYREREAQFTNRISFLAGYKEGHIAGATAENERAQKLVEALNKIKDLCEHEDYGNKAENCPACLASTALQQWNAGKEPQFEGSIITEPAPGIALGCISPEARELLDTIMEHWEAHYKTVKTDTYEPTFYAFAYWLVRWSGLIRPAGKEVEGLIKIDQGDLANKCGWPLPGKDDEE